MTPAPPSSPVANLYPPPAFYFKVVFTGLVNTSDTSFQEVRGIASEMETEDVPEGGENRFVHRLPVAVTHPQLELKRGIAPLNSPLIQWCQNVLESSFNIMIEPSPVNVYLLNEKGDPVRGWSFANAFPIKWEVDEFNSTKNDVAIETIVLSYSYAERLV